MPFKPGQSGNPSGRRAPPGESIAEIFRRCTDPEEVHAILIGIARDGQRSRDRVAAAMAILDRGWGKPISTIELQARMTPLPEAEREQRQLRVLTDADLEVLAKLDAIGDELEIDTLAQLPAPAPEVIEAGSDGS